MTQIEFERKLSQLEADYITKRNASDKAIAEVKKEEREHQRKYYDAISDCQNRIANLKEVQNSQREDYLKAKAEIYTLFQTEE